MKFLLLAFISSLAARVAAVPASVPYSVHEKRNMAASTSRWEQKRHLKLNRRSTIPMKIALAQPALYDGHELLMAVSDPTSDSYGKHWTPAEVADFFAAPTESIEQVTTWLSASGIVEERITISKGRNWIKCDVTIEEAESLLKTEYKVYESKSGRRSLAVDEYSVPLSVRDHIDFITPTVHFDAVISRRDDVSSSFHPGPNSEPVEGYTPVDPAEDRSLGVVPLVSETPNLSPTNLSGCHPDVTPECIRALYTMPNGTLAKSSYGIVEFAPESFIPNDLEIFLHNLGPWIPSNTQPKVDSIDGGEIQTGPKASFNESNLDLQLAVSLVYPQQVTVYEVGEGLNGPGSFNTFLDAVDGTYCTADGGDNPKYDPVYASHREDCGAIKPASVISVSYGADESSIDDKYATRQCNEYLKLGLQGITIIYASGDNGVAGSDGSCCISSGCRDGETNYGSSGFYNPGFAATCPYITAVGATYIPSGHTVHSTIPEYAAPFTGGGFSNIFPAPDYQKPTIQKWAQAHQHDSNIARYNINGRAFPDISANGINITTVVQGKYVHLSGTSASAPIVGALFTLINNQLAQSGKPPVGFVNPVLYRYPQAMNDVTMGSNPGCGTKGFTAEEGWDPVSGLGTPNYGRLLKVFMGL